MPYPEVDEVWQGGNAWSAAIGDRQRGVRGRKVVDARKVPGSRPQVVQAAGRSRRINNAAVTQA
jgi:hypothetical protein